MPKPGGEAHPLRPRKQICRTPRPAGRGGWTPSPVPLRAQHQENQLYLLAPLKTRTPPQTVLSTPPWGPIHSSGLRPSTGLPGAVWPGSQHPHWNQLAVALGSAVSAPWNSALLGPLRPSAPESAHQPDLGVSSGRRHHTCQVREQRAQAPRPQPPCPLPRASSQQRPG